MTQVRLNVGVACGPVAGEEFIQVDMLPTGPAYAQTFLNLKDFVPFWENSYEYSRLIAT
jgi:hypothetical protein